jgi:FkbM family methyltransferase
MSNDANLIFDIGAHLGHDTGYYLEEGFRVIAVEPHPLYAQRLLNRFGAFKGCWTIPAAITAAGGPCELFLSSHPLGETHSIHPHRVRNGDGSTITVAGCTIVDIIERTASPHYLKVDIEGSDLIPLRQLAPTAHRPDYISIELDHGHEDDALEAFFLLWGMGYEVGQLVNQARVREGEYGERFAGGGYSGPFGERLPKDRWCDLPKCLLDWMSRHNENGDWYDLHVQHRDYQPEFNQEFSPK